jgi:hypothetical protein
MVWIHAAETFAVDIKYMVEVVRVGKVGSRLLFEPVIVGVDGNHEDGY